MSRKALGRGLGALLSSDRTIDLGGEPSEVELSSIVPGPMQPRVSFDEAALALKQKPYTDADLLAAAKIRGISNYAVGFNNVDPYTDGSN